MMSYHEIIKKREKMRWDLIKIVYQFNLKQQIIFLLQIINKHEFSIVDITLLILWCMICISVGTFQQVRCKTGREYTKKATKMIWKAGRAAKKMIFLTQILLCTFSVPQSFLLRFSWSFDNFTVSNKKNRPKSLYQCIWNNYITSVQKHYNFTILSIWVVYKYMRV